MLTTLVFPAQVPLAPAAEFRRLQEPIRDVWLFQRLGPVPSEISHRISFSDHDLSALPVSFAGEFKLVPIVLSGKETDTIPVAMRPEVESRIEP
jgi:hypothetical protein